MSKKQSKSSFLVFIITYCGGFFLVHNSSLLITQPCIRYVDAGIGLLVFFGIFKVCNLAQAFYRWYNGIENVS
ncbi:hypothetical protein [Serratia proteamaculans]|uniref:hypothetical protein n=1 Tax=Serratia proteamaculans TaxID=28151 RepID=UPI00217906AC|nr:hypothetical protein [Serratia proteamaculans]CAI1532461.1 Uncharacterised protein [Serratia proteamaculans]CAI2411637.1 Uncharacterised protein [Serratia proteamaculans]